MTASSSVPSSPPSSALHLRPSSFVTARRAPVLAIAAVFLAGHLAYLPTALEDIDSVNFALGVRDFDPTRHQPHPPGYPVYIGLGKLSAAAIAVAAPSLERQTVDALALAWWSAAGGAIAVVAAVYLLALLRRLSGDAGRPLEDLIAATLLATVPLFWISGLRPLSDMPGLASALLVQALIARSLIDIAEERPAANRRLALAAAFAGLALGVRSQLLWLVFPLLVVAVCYRWRGMMIRGAIVAGASALGAMAWAVPLVAASGGLDNYLAALRSIAGEDFSQVRMLWTHPSGRTLVLALHNTFIKAWSHPTLGVVALLPAVAGLLFLLARARPLLAWMVVTFAPYGVFHLLFQDTEFVRYALPLVVPVVWLAARSLSAIPIPVAPVVVAGLAGASLVITLPVARAYSAMPMPVSRAIGAAEERLALEGGVVAGHFEFARSLSVSGVPADAVLPVTLFDERQSLVRYFTGGGDGPVWFVAAPARTDLLLVDPYARTRLLQSAWQFSRDWFLGGTRPAYAELVRIGVPGWVAGHGWHLTREELILTERRGSPPPMMFVRRRDEPSIMFIGGEYLDAAGVDRELRLTIDEREVARIPLQASSPAFFAEIRLPPDAMPLRREAGAASPFASLQAAWRTSAGDGSRVQLTQFELQPPDRLFWVFSHGWHDREWDTRREREWRWTGERAQLRVHPGERDLILRIAGEVPTAALGGPPTLTVSAGPRVLKRWRADKAFNETIPIARVDLEAARGLLEISTDRTFAPGGADPRRLGVQVFEILVNQVMP